MTERLLTPTKITAWLDCAHYLTLLDQVDAGELELDGPRFGSFAQLLFDKGNEHEAACLARYEAEGKTVYRVSPRAEGESFAQWVERVGAPWERGYDVIYQMPFLHDGIRGIADFLLRVEDPRDGSCVYEPLDAKLARREAKPGHLLQLCFYAEALKAVTGAPASQIHLWLGSGEVESFRTDEFLPYWRRLRQQLRDLLVNDAPSVETRPEPCAHCKFCEFADVCDAVWTEEDSLLFVHDIRVTDRRALEEAGVHTAAELATYTSEVPSMRAQRLERLQTQAELQVRAKAAPDEPPPFRVIESEGDPPWGHGLEMLPPPNPGDVFLDFEGDPFWKPEHGLFFLFGLIACHPDGTWRYQGAWAHDQDGEEIATRDLIEWLAERRAAHPDMHVYHYNHTERTALESLAAFHGVGEPTLGEQISTGFFVDLYQVVRNAIQVGTRSYGLKYVERLADFERSHDIDRGAAAVTEYERFRANGDAAILPRIAAYNEDDVRATLALRDWLVGLRSEGLPWRDPWQEPEESHPDLDARIAALHAYGPGAPEHLLGDVLGYWVREYAAHLAPKLAKLTLDPTEGLDDPAAIVDLRFVGLESRFGVKGKELKDPGARFAWPEQEVSPDFESDRNGVLFSTSDGNVAYANVAEVNWTTRELLLIWSDKLAQLDEHPGALALNDWVPPGSKPEALDGFAADILGAEGSGPPNSASLSLLHRELPRFVSGGGPAGGVFVDDLEAMRRWATELDGSCLAVQGPPGTGKTYWGAHIVHALVREGRRVGITAMSHHAIDNLLKETLKVFEHEGDAIELKAVRKPSGSDSQPRFPGVTYQADNKKCATGDFNLIAGTTWPFAGKDFRGAPVDVLIVDEAGQLSLADALAASTSARNVVLLGDPLQLSQVSQALHPGGAGQSILEHILGDDDTMPADRGVFLTEARRMHPDVCRFISDEIYEGRLHSHPDCARQTTVAGTGLRWIRAEHDGRSTESLEEAQLVAAEIRKLIGTKWVDSGGAQADLDIGDFMVVAPYNDQVALLRTELDRDPVTRGVPVGTVDKFQGQQAPVVFFTMTTSSSEHMPRSADFLFSRNRLNVAISRARCLAYLVCTEELLNSRAKDVPQMRLISTLCSYVEYVSDKS